MEINYGPRGTLEINDAIILFPNFEGRESMYNRRGDRNFSIAIDNFEDAEILHKKGWNVKVESPDLEFVEELQRHGWNAKHKPKLDPDEGPRMRLDVKVKYNRRDDGSVWGPAAYVWSGHNRRELDEDTIGTLDHIERDCVNLDIVASNWNVNGRTGRTAYLDVIEVFQRTNRFQERYNAMRSDDMMDY
jgi:hypothetical protein